MRGLVDRPAVAILIRRRGSGACFQRLNFSAGRGRGRSDVEDAQVPEFGAGGGVASGSGAGVGRGLGLGDFGIGLGRGRADVSPPLVPSQPPIFEPFTLRSPGVVPEKPGPSQQNQPSKFQRNASEDSRYEDAIAEKDVKTNQGNVPAPGVSPDALQGAGRGDFTNRRLNFRHRGQEGAGRGLPVSQMPRESSSPAAVRDLRQRAPNAERARASAWGSLSQILAAPGKPVVQPEARGDSQESSVVGIPVEPNVPEVAKGDSQTSGHVSESSSSAQTSQTASTGASDPVFHLSDARYVDTIKYHEAAGRLAEVDKIYEEMRAGSIPITIPTYNLLIQIFSQAGQFDKMDKVYSHMRQALTQVQVQPKEDEQTPVSQTSPQQAPDVPVTLEEQVAVTAHQVDESAPVTHSDDLSARLGECDSPTMEPASSPGAVVKENVVSPQVPSFKLPTPEPLFSEDKRHGKGFAQHLEESNRPLAFRGLPPPGEENSKVGAFNRSILSTPPSPSIFGGVAGRGRGAPLPQAEGHAGRGQRPLRPPRGVQQAQIGADPTTEETSVHIQLSREQARDRAMSLLAQGEESRSQRRVSPPTPARTQLSREDAVQRAVAVMEEGVERNLSREEEKRRRRGTAAFVADKFSDATNFVAERFRRRTPDSGPQQARGPSSAKDRFKRQPRFIQRREGEEEPQVPLTLREMTEEDEQRLRVLEEEEQYKSALHSKFLVDFEPEYAMEHFGTNPDIDELPQKPLTEILADMKPFLMVEGITEEQWQGEVQDVLEKAPHLENLVNLYAGGPNRLTAREQVSKLQAVAETMPAHVAPEIQDFMSQVQLTLQSNPGISMKKKEHLMNRFVSGLSSF